MDTANPGVLKAIEEKKILDDDLRAAMTKVIKEFKGALRQRASGSGARRARNEPMANVLDIRRRIRSVKNTRQITKAMKMVAAAKLRRAQERALASRAYAQMLANVLKSTVSRTELVDPQDRRAVNPLLAHAARAEHSAGAGHRRSRTGRRVQLECAEGGDQVSRHFKDKNIDIAGRRAQGPRLHAPALSGGQDGEERRAGKIQIVGEHLNLLGKVEYEVGVGDRRRDRRSLQRGADRFGVRASSTNSSRSSRSG